MNKFFSIVLLLVTNICLSQTGIGIEKPEADLDINVFTKFSNLPEVSDRLREYTRVLYIDKDGNVGVKERNKDKANYIYRTSHFPKMNDKLEFYLLHSLELEKTVLVPPYTNSFIEVSYNIPVITVDAALGNLSILLSKTVNNKETFLYESTRTFSHAKVYGGGTGNGRTIYNVYYDEVQNNTNSPMFFTYKVYGNTSHTVLTRFGMFNKTSSFSWGTGSLNINVFDY